MTRFLFSTSMMAVALMAAPAAFAKPITTVEHFTTGKHTEVTDRVTVHTKTGVVDAHTTIAKADGKVKTIAEKATPSATGGYTVSKSVTGFNGMSKTSTSHSGVSAGHGKA